MNKKAPQNEVLFLCFRGLSAELRHKIRDSSMNCVKTKKKPFPIILRMANLLLMAS